MRAVVYDRYGAPEVLRVEDVERPEPKDDEVLVRVHATTVTQTDCHMRRARPLIWRFMLGLRRPKRRTWARSSRVKSRLSGRLSPSSRSATVSSA